jgi:hypothetical protein
MYTTRSRVRVKKDAVTVRCFLGKAIRTRRRIQPIGEDYIMIAEESIDNPLPLGRDRGTHLGTTTR